MLIAFALLLLFIFIGDGFLRVMNLSPLSLQIAGGVILFLSAPRLIFPPPEPVGFQDVSNAVAARANP